MHQKVDVLIFYDICPKREVLRIFFMFDLLPFFPQNYKKSLAIVFLWIYKMTFPCPSSLTFVAREPLLPLPLQNPLEHDNKECSLKINMLGTSSSRVTLTFFSWCKLKWSWNKFNNQSHILEEQRTTSHSRCKSTIKENQQLVTNEPIEFEK